MHCLRQLFTVGFDQQIDLTFGFRTGKIFGGARVVNTTLTRQELILKMKPPFAHSALHRRLREICGREGPSISKLKTSLANARVLESDLVVSSMPMIVIAAAMTQGSSSKLVIDSANELIDSCSLAGRSGSGITLMVSEFEEARCNMISVANRVHRLSFLGTRISVRASRTELFPLGRVGWIEQGYEV